MVPTFEEATCCAVKFLFHNRLDNLDTVVCLLSLGLINYERKSLPSLPPTCFHFFWNVFTESKLLWKMPFFFFFNWKPVLSYGKNYCFLSLKVNSFCSKQILFYKIWFIYNNLLKVNYKVKNLNRPLETSVFLN